MASQPINYRKLTIEQFLQEASAPQPAPSGGSTAALTGALASSMAQMVLNLTIGKEKYKHFEADCKKRLASLEKAQKMMLELMDEDIAAFGGYTDAIKLAKDDPERAGRVAEAMKQSVAVPQEICAAALAILDDMDAIKDKSNPHLLGDLGVAAALAAAVVKSAAFSIKANFAFVKDPAELEKIKDQIKHDEEKAQKTLNSIENFLASKF